MARRMDAELSSVVLWTGVPTQGHQESNPNAWRRICDLRKVSGAIRTAKRKSVGGRVCGIRVALKHITSYFGRGSGSATGENTCIKSPPYIVSCAESPASSVHIVTQKLKIEPRRIFNAPRRASPLKP